MGLAAIMSGVIVLVMLAQGGKINFVLCWQIQRQLTQLCSINPGFSLGLCCVVQKTQKWLCTSSHLLDRFSIFQLFVCVYTHMKLLVLVQSSCSSSLCSQKGFQTGHGQSCRSVTMTCRLVIVLLKSFFLAWILSFFPGFLLWGIARL